MYHPLLAALLLVGLANLAPAGAANAPVTGSVDWHDVRQSIDCWGASGAWLSVPR